MTTAFKIKKETENNFIFSNGSDQFLFGFGSQHTFDPAHPQFDLIERFWKEFLVSTKKGSRTVFVEGGKRPVYKQKEDTIINDGEAGLLTWLANKDRIVAQSPEPSDSWERRKLEKIFSKEEIELYYFSRVVYQWTRYTKKPNFNQYITSFLKDEEKQSGWKNFDFSLINLTKIYKRHLKKAFDKNDTRFLYSIINPTYKKSPTVVNEVSKRSGALRDEYISGRILKSWNAGKSIFFVYGKGHLEVLKESFSRSLTKK